VRPHRILAAACGLLLACSSQKFEPIPKTIDPDKVPQQKVEMTAKKYEFIPAEVHVKQGTLVTLEVESVEGTHAIALGLFGIDEPLPLHEKKTIRFYAAEKGEIPFVCSHFCGMGHFGMKGKFVVE
jgi:heme/copper-type cytochrome/quinol oxidase subunit 2